MINATNICILFQITVTKVAQFSVFGFVIGKTLYAFMFNSIALFATWNVNRRQFSRTVKLLLVSFAINIFVAFSVASLSIYLFYDDFIQTWYFSAHLSLVTFFLVCSSTNMFLVTVDRYLLVVRGSWYLRWKRNFQCISCMLTFITSGFAIPLYFVLRECRYSFAVVYLSVLAAYLYGSLFGSLLTNIVMMRFIRKQMSAIGSSRPNLKKKVSKTVCFMTVSVGFFQFLLASLVTLLTISYTVETFLLKFRSGLIISSIIVSLFKCCTFPFIYIVRNSQIRKYLSV